MKAILEFNLPEEQEDYEIYHNAFAYFSALRKIYNKIRQLDKYESKESVNIQDLWGLFNDATDGLEI